MWQGWKIGFEVQSPLHIGRLTQGNVQYTRRLVPGRSLWGALTARLARDMAAEANLRTVDYLKVGEWVNDNLALSYFYLSTAEHAVTLWPWKNTSEFEWRYLSSYTSTALHDGHTKQDSSLHEVEFLAPRTRPGDQVFLLGFVFSRENVSDKWKNSLSRLQVGGERSYGWGRVRLLHLSPATQPEFLEFFGSEVGLNGPRPSLTIGRGEPLRAHLSTQDFSGNLDGSIEPLVGRQTNPNGNAIGTEVSAPVFAWSPGSLPLHPTPIEIGSYGIWGPTVLRSAT